MKRCALLFLVLTLLGCSLANFFPTGYVEVTVVKDGVTVLHGTFHAHQVKASASELKLYCTLLSCRMIYSKAQGNSWTITKL